MAIFLILLGFRIALVRMGLLFGADRILAVDVAISAVLVLAIATGRRLSIRRPAGTPPPEGTALPDWLGMAAAVLGLPALVISTANLLAPATPNGLSPEACVGAPIYGWKYYGVTTGPTGNYARSGPGLSFPQTDRFDSDCTLGFVGYCIGDPVIEPLTKWPETRWLLVGRHSEGSAMTWARWLSGETGERRFVTHAYITPKSPDRRVRYLGDKECASGRAQPSNVTINPGSVTDAGIQLKLHADNAEWMGVALALPTTYLRGGSAVRPVSSQPLGANGDAEVIWTAARTLLQLKANRTESINIAVIAIACLGPVGPAPAATAAFLNFQVTPDDSITMTGRDQPTHDVTENLRQAACSEGSTAEEKSPAPSSSN